MNKVVSGGALSFLTLHGMHTGMSTCIYSDAKSSFEDDFMSSHGGLAFKSKMPISRGVCASRMPRRHKKQHSRRSFLSGRG